PPAAALTRTAPPKQSLRSKTRSASGLNRALPHTRAARPLTSARSEPPYQPARPQSPERGRSFRGAPPRSTHAARACVGPARVGPRSVLEYASTGADPKHRPRPGSADVLTGHPDPVSHNALRTLPGTRSEEGGRPRERSPRLWARPGG